VSAGLRIAIVTDEPGWHGAELRRALEARNAEVRFVSLRECRLELARAGSGIVVPQSPRSAQRSQKSQSSRPSTTDSSKPPATSNAERRTSAWEVARLW